MNNNKNKVSFLTALLSIMAAAFGVQKSKNMERDLNATNPVVYVLAALVFVAIFIAAIAIVVSLVVPDRLA
ncbi:DUF2970 domain-containing protein [Pseudomonas sp. HK3]|jgi:hypothetical protein